MKRLLRTLRLKRDLSRRLRERKAARLVRADAAHRGVSSYWRRSAARTREVFGL